MKLAIIIIDKICVIHYTKQSIFGMNCVIF